MEISTDIAARVSAYFNGWVDPEAFAKSAEKGAIYQQRHYLTRDKLFSFYVLDKDNQRVPIEQLTSTDRLGVVLAHNSVVPEMLVLLSNIEHARGQKEGEDVYEVQVVSQVGTDNTTREAKYACISFKSTEELASKIIAKANKTSGDQEQRVVYDDLTPKNESSFHVRLANKEKGGNRWSGRHSNQSKSSTSCVRPRSC